MTTAMPEGFVYLDTIDDSILEEIRYAMPHNLVGRVIDGYGSKRCVTTIGVANGLKAVQAEVNALGYTLKVYETYRPLRAGIDFTTWSQGNCDLMRMEFYPAINKADLFDLGYLAFRSEHTRGCAVDLTLVPLPVPDQDVFKPGDIVLDGRLPKGQRFNDNSIEMGTCFDCMDELSHTMNPKISAEG
ncbi:MAG: M15 family metallopeptidase [Alphaproteobacteria bacterium]